MHAALPDQSQVGSRRDWPSKQRTNNLGEESGAKIQRWPTDGVVGKSVLTEHGAVFDGRVADEVRGQLGETQRRRRSV